MSMTTQEMQLAICKKLPELIGIDHVGLTEDGQPCDLFYWKNSTAKRQFGVNWPTEGLQVCHEAEKLVAQDHWQLYVKCLYEQVCEVFDEPFNTDPTTTYCVIVATYEQRLEALCRVWFPERFTT